MAMRAFGELADFGDLDHVMAGKLGRARVLGIGRSEHRGAAARQQKGGLRQQDLRARPRHDMGWRRRAIGLGGDLLERREVGRLGQTLA